MTTRQPPIRLRRGAGPVERATFYELKALGLVRTPHGAAALKGAELVDLSTSSTSYAAAARELRITLQTARSVGNLLSPFAARKSALEPKVPGVDEIAAARRRAEARRVAGATTSKRTRGPAR